jgi:hypothetical protein
MNSPGALDDDMPAEIDFSGGERGKFYRPNAVLRFVCPDTVNAEAVNTFESPARPPG